MLRRLLAAISAVGLCVLSLWALSHRFVHKDSTVTEAEIAGIRMEASHKIRPAIELPLKARGIPGGPNATTTSQVLVGTTEVLPTTTAAVSTTSPVATTVTTPTTLASTTTTQTVTTTAVPVAAPPSTTSTPVSTTVAPPSGYVVISPGQNIQDAINSNAAGTAFLLRAGVHSASGLTPKDRQQFVGEEGAVLSGGNRLALAFVGDAANVLIDNLVIENYANRPQFGAIHATGPGWTIRNSEFRYNAGAGLAFNSGWRVSGNYIHHNSQIGIIGSSAGAIVENNEIAFNNWTDAYDPNWEAGGSKFVRTQGLIVRNNYVHDNHGPGLWTDYNNVNTLYEGNTVIGNYGPGIFHEISYDAVIRNNRVEGNAFQFYTGGILITESSNVEVSGNSVSGNDGGIVAIQGSGRGSGDYGAFIVENLWVHNNSVTYQQGWTGVSDQVGDGAVYTRNNRFEANVYTVPQAYNGWYWKGAIPWAQWTALGHDV